MATELHAEWGRRLRGLRRQRELTVLELARLVEVSPQYVYLLEAGRHAPSDEVRVRLASALDVDPNDLFDLTAEVA